MRQSFFFGREPTSRFGSISDEKVTNDAESHGDEPFNKKELPPGMKRANPVYLEDSTGEEASKGAGERCANDIQRQPEDELVFGITSSSLVYHGDM